MNAQSELKQISKREIEGKFRWVEDKDGVSVRRPVYEILCTHENKGKVYQCRSQA